MPMARGWNGMDLERRKARASGRAIVAIAVNVAADTKRISHRISGTLVRSTHAAIPNAFHDDDEERAATADLLLSGGRIFPLITPLGAVIEVGSWLPYACVEWVGRKHPGITQGLEQVFGSRADAIVKQAFREEGL